MEVKIVSGFKRQLLNAGVAPVPHAGEGLRGAVADYFDPLEGFRVGDQVCEYGKYLCVVVVGWGHVRGWR